jgi:hypothetical protein
MKNKTIIPVTIICFALLNYAVMKPARAGGVVVFGTPVDNPTIMALTSESILSSYKTFNRLGRFMPVESNRLESAIKKTFDEKQTFDVYYEKTARGVNADIYVLISINQSVKTTFAEIKIIPINPSYRPVQRYIRLKSRIMRNIPMKISREIAYIHQGLPVSAEITKSIGGRTYSINAGSWSGLSSDKKIKTVEGEGMDLIHNGAYESIVTIHGPEKKSGDKISIGIYPDSKTIINEIEERITDNTENLYGISLQIKGGDPRKKYIQGLCIINPGGNLCLPGYGAFLSTGYLGFENAKPDIPGIALSASNILLHMTIPQMMTGFKSNFFPWIKDRDKSVNNQNLQIFLWASLPLTFSAAYLDQLAVQFSTAERLPPFFKDRDCMAAALSVFIPGGGMFYKGYRMAGWSYYFAGMGLAGYGIYNIDNGKSGRYALIALGIVKCAELISVFLIEPSYRFFNMEMERESKDASLSVGLNRFNDRENIYSMSVGYSF